MLAAASAILAHFRLGPSTGVVHFVHFDALSAASPGYITKIGKRKVKLRWQKIKVRRLLLFIMPASERATLEQTQA